MKKWLILILLLVFSSHLLARTPMTAEEILRRIDETQNIEKQIIQSSMIINSIRGSRTIEYKSWIVGKEKSFTESLAPAREKGTKMLKLEDNLWIYDPRADRTIKIAGHMLRQSMSGSDLSYEDMMEKGKLLDNYQAELTEETTLNGSPVWVLLLTAKTIDVAYQSRKIWIDKEQFIALKEELFAASGKLLKLLETRETFKTSRGWYPKRMIFKDVLKQGKGTEFIVHSVDFETAIPDSKFSKAALSR